MYVSYRDVYYKRSRSAVHIGQLKRYVVPYVPCMLYTNEDYTTTSIVHEYNYHIHSQKIHFKLTFYVLILNVFA